MGTDPGLPVYLWMHPWTTDSHPVSYRPTASLNPGQSICAYICACMYHGQPPCLTPSNSRVSPLCSFSSTAVLTFEALYHIPGTEDVA